MRISAAELTIEIFCAQQCDLQVAESQPAATPLLFARPPRLQAQTVSPWRGGVSRAFFSGLARVLVLSLPCISVRHVRFCALSSFFSSTLYPFIFSSFPLRRFPFLFASRTFIFRPRLHSKRISEYSSIGLIVAHSLISEGLGHAHKLVVPNMRQSLNHDEFTCSVNPDTAAPGLRKNKRTLDFGNISRSVVCSQVPHWMNLSFAQAPHRQPHGSAFYAGRHDSGPTSRPTVPAGLAGAAPVRDDYVAGFDELPIPKLVDPPVFGLNPDGSINMASISLPPVLAALLGLNRDREEENEEQGERSRRAETEERGEPPVDCKERSDGSPVSPEEQSKDGPSESRERQCPEGSSGTSVSQAETKNRSSSSQISGNQYRTPPQPRKRDNDDNCNYNDNDTVDESERQLETIPTEKTYEWGNVERVWPQPAPGIRGLMAAGPNTSSAIKNSSPSSLESAAGTTTVSGGGGGGGGIMHMSTASTTPSLILARQCARLPAQTAWQGGSGVGGGNSSGGSGGSSGSSGGGGGGGSSGGMVPTPPMRDVVQRLKSSHPSASAIASNRLPEV